MHEIRTARMRLRPVQPGDLEALHATFTDADFRRYMWDDEIIARDVTEGVIAQSERQFQEQGHGLWLAYLHDGDTLAGLGGFWYFHEPPQLELLYGLRPACWGRGLATEIAVALLAHGFGRLGFARVIGSTDAPNTASCRVMERAGMRLLRRESAEGRDTVFYVVERAESAPC